MELEHTYLYAALTLAISYTMVSLIALLLRKRSLNKQSHIVISGRESATTIVIASLFVMVVVVVAFLLSRTISLLRGDALQAVLALACLASGLIAGIGMAARLRRVAFVESLWVGAIVMWLPTLRAMQAAELLGFGTATAYFAAVLFAGGLILLLALTLGGALGYLFFGDGRASFTFSFESFIGRRFLMAKRGSHVVSLITVISIFAVMVGTGGMIVVMSVMNGFSSDLRSKIMGTNAHLLILKYGNDYSDYPKIIRQLDKIPDIVGKTPFVLNEVMVSSQDNLSGAVIKGIDSDTVGQVTTLPQTIIEGDLKYLQHPEQMVSLHKNDIKPSKDGPYHSELGKLGKAEDENAKIVLPGIIVGQEMAKSLRVFLGDVVNVVSPVGELGPTGPIPKARAFRVAGIFHTGMYEYDAKFSYIALSEAQSFFNLKKSITGIECRVNDFEQTPSIARAVRDAIGGYPYYTKDWMQMNSSIFSALKLEKIAMFIILTTLIFMASLLILVTLIIVVIEKGKEIAILKSMGATDASVMKIFVTYGLSVGGVGAFLGLCLGLTLCFLIKVFGIGLDSQVYYISSLPVKIDSFEVILVVSSAVIVSFLATVPPSLFAARLRPVEGLRYE